MGLTIEDLLKSLKSPNEANDGFKLTPQEVWDLIADGEDWKAIGFDSKEDFDDYLEKNPYENL